ncbi:hypothetical protein [Rhizobium sp. SL86]|uniref:hypothetical protein n=1 Tax=Rhizobium sp. SL86 TaxID=2995148 RepID=UPI0022734CAB|nr:hypothetical protein [Rhizobium sp. SL86]MCY1667883.1 hypothetical protein [Rhizobium sp. SL86]
MTALLTSRIKTLVAQSRCPACGAQIVSGGGGIAFAISTFECGAEFVIANEEIAVSRACPSASHVAARHLNQEAAASLAKAGPIC